MKVGADDLPRLHLAVKFLSRVRLQPVPCPHCPQCPHSMLLAIVYSLWSTTWLRC